MRSVVAAEHGGPEVLRLEETSSPEPAAGQVLIRVHRAGVTAPVVRQVRGTGAPVELPFSPGGDIAGTVAALGEEVTGFAEGDRVAGIAFSGAYAEYACASAGFVTKLPEAVGFADAAAVVRNGQVALGALRAAEVGEGDTVAVTGAAGGVGHLAVRLARLLGAEWVLGVVGDLAKARFLRELGVDEVLDYPGFGTEEQTDRVVDGVGGEVLTRSVAALREFGTAVTFSAADGGIDTTPLRMGMRTVRGFGMAPFVRRYPDRYAEQHHELWDWVAAGRLCPSVREYPLDEASRAHRDIEQRAVLGKAVLTVS